MFGNLIRTCLETPAATAAQCPSCTTFFLTGFGMSRLRYELMGKPGLKVGQRDSCLYLIDSYDFYLVGLYLAGACLRTIRFEDL